jgi:HSP20 family molecular chaperone IbpA
LYCRRGNRKESALEDWLLAERERDAAVLVGVADEDRDIHITACVPGVNAADLAVDVLPNEIVVEADRNGKVERFTRPREPGRQPTSASLGISRPSMEALALFRHAEAFSQCGIQ